MTASNTDNKKPYNLIFEQRERYLYAAVDGDEDTVEISAQYWQEVADKCKELGTKRVLIVEDLPGGGVTSMMDVYELATALPQMGFLGIRVAFVDAHLDQQSVNEFGELVATNRGLYGKIFNNFADGEHWILND
jgi:hypothetical protein